MPALLAAFAGVAEKPGGPQKLADAAKQEVGTLDKFAGMLGATGQTSVVERGSRMLGSLLGGDQPQLATAVGKYSGVGASKGGSLLGALGPLVMGAIAQQQGPRALDGAVSPVFSQARKTTSPPRFPRASASCLAVQACSMRSAIRQEEQLRQAAKQHGPLPPR